MFSLITELSVGVTTMTTETLSSRGTRGVMQVWRYCFSSDPDYAYPRRYLLGSIAGYGYLVCWCLATVLGLGLAMIGGDWLLAGLVLTSGAVIGVVRESMVLQKLTKEQDERSRFLFPADRLLARQKAEVPLLTHRP